MMKNTINNLDGLSNIKYRLDKKIVPEEKDEKEKPRPIGGPESLPNEIK